MKVLKIKSTSEGRLQDNAYSQAELFDTNLLNEGDMGRFALTTALL